MVFFSARLTTFSAQPSLSPVSAFPVLHYVLTLALLALHSSSLAPAFEISIPIEQSRKINITGSDYLSITFTRPKNAIDVTYQIEISSNLTSWTTTPLLATTTDLGNGREQVTYRDTTP